MQPQKPDLVAFLIDFTLISLSVAAVVYVAATDIICF